MSTFCGLRAWAKVQSKNSWSPFSQITVGLHSVKEQLVSVQSKNSWFPFSQRTGVVTDHDAGTDNTQSTVINPTGGCPVPVASTSAQSDTRQLQSTVEALANQMAWFVEKMTQAEEAYDESDQQEVDEASAGLNTVSDAPMTDTTPEGGGGKTQVDTLTGLEHFYNVVDTVGSDVDQQLATIVNNLTKYRLAEEKLKEKLVSYVRPGSCEGLTVTSFMAVLNTETISYLYP